MTLPSESHPVPAPRAIVCSKVDTMGDLVLFEPVLRAFREYWPKARVVIVVRETYAPLARRIAPEVEWLPTSLNPFVDSPQRGNAELDRIREAIAAVAADVAVAATSTPNWLDTVVAAGSGAARRVTLGTAVDDAFFSTQLRVQLGIDAGSAFTEHISHAATEPDWERNRTLAQALVGDVRVGNPQITAAESERTAARVVLQSLSTGAYAVCAAAGFANVALKTWPAARFAASVKHLHARHALPTVLVGSGAERAHLEAVASAASSPCLVWTGGTHDWPTLIGLISGASVFLGNDTGAMHLAAALGQKIVAVFGGGTWPRFVPATAQHVSVVHPLPCFGCGWDCAFGDAPCIGLIGESDVAAALDSALASSAPPAGGIQAVNHIDELTRGLMDRAAAQYRASRADHLARQHKLEELTALDREKDEAILEKEAEIAAKEAEIDAKSEALTHAQAQTREKEKEIESLRVVCDEREKLIFVLDRNSRAYQTQVTTVLADKALLEKSLEQYPADKADAVRTIAGQASHIRNLEALVGLREREIAELKASVTNLASGHTEVERAKHFGRLLAEKEKVIQSLSRTCRERDAVIQRLLLETTGIGGRAAKGWTAVRSMTKARITDPVRRWWTERMIDRHWMQIGELRQYEPRSLRWDSRVSAAAHRAGRRPKIGIVTPSYGQERFVERTIRSVLDQNYPELLYVVQDGGSKDRSPEIIAQHATRLAHWESVKDNGQADAIARGFRHIEDQLGADDLMAWLNSDDLLAPGALSCVANFFANHPNVDVVYGHRIIIDDDDREVGRWIMPPHDRHVLEWVDYVPQETLFWRKRAWTLVGGIDPSFQFALDWDLIARFQQANCTIVRLPFFLGAFRVHSEQKTSQVINSIGADEMRRIRVRFHDEAHDDAAKIEHFARKVRVQGVLTARLMELGIRR